MARYARKTAILAEIEGTYGVDPTPTGSANAILVSECTINPLNAQNRDRALVRPYFGASEQLVGTANIEISFTVELAGSGVADDPPAWAPLLKACGFAEDTSGTGFVSYTPDTESTASLTIYYYDAGGSGNGALHKAHGCRGTAAISMELGERPAIRFTFTGIDGGVSDAALPATTLTGFQKPLVITDDNSGDFTVGCTYAAGTLGGGTTYPSRGLSLDLGNQVVHQPLLGSDTVEITGREITSQVQLDLTAAQEVTFMGYVTGNTTQQVGLQHGTTTGNIVLLHAPAAQFINPRKEEMDGRRLIGFDLRLVPSSGDDELRIVTK